jgi:hypothetical protein
LPASRLSECSLGLFVSHAEVPRGEMLSRLAHG